LGDIAVTDAVCGFQIARPMLFVERVHFERRRVHHVTRPDESVEHAVIAQDVTDVLTQEAFDALPELLYALRVDLRHPQRPVSGVAASGVKRAKDYLARIRDDYQRSYYSGVVAERRGQALLTNGGMGSGGMAYESLREAMDWYAKAEAIRPPGNDDAILRWNTCVRVLSGNSHLAPAADTGYEPVFED